MGSAWVDSGRVSTREDGSELYPAWVTDHFQELSAAAELPPIRLHDLRHGAASLMLAVRGAYESSERSQLRPPRRPPR